MTGYQITSLLKNDPIRLSLSCPQRPDLLFMDSVFSIELRKHGKHVHAPLSYASEQDCKANDLPFTPCLNKLLKLDLPALQIGGWIQIAQDSSRQYLCTRMKIENLSTSPVTLRRIELLNTGCFNQISSSEIHLSHEPVQNEMAFYSNGWQSWSFSGAYGARQQQKKSWLRFIPNAVSSNPDTPYLTKKGHFSGDFYGVLGSRTSRGGLLMGFLSQKQQFGTLEADLRAAPGMRVWANCDDVCLEPGDGLETDWLVFSWLDLNDPNALQPYFQLVAKYHAIDEKKSIPTGWCSWYQYFTHIDQHRIDQNVELLTGLKKVLPIELVQIDDGFQAAGGDWLQFTPGFPDGVEPSAVKIKQNDLKPGLWLAPFIVSKDASLLQEHPDYILRNRFGWPVFAGVISEKVSTALDLSYPPALEYASEVVRTAAKDWGFSYLKLDFLYAGALPGTRWDKSRTRAQILRGGLEQIRDAVGEETFLLGCGVPLGSALGLFDAMRIGADTDVRWKPKLFNIPLLFRNDPQLPSTRNAIQNTITRSGLHRNWWINDPDCLLVRPQTELSDIEIKTHATLIGLSGGSMLLSDDLSSLPLERIKIPSLLLPLIGKRPMVMDWFDNLTPEHLRLDLEGAIGRWSLLAYFNWSDQAQHVVLRGSDFSLNNHPLWVSSFWDEKVIWCENSQEIWQQTLPPHGVILLAVREDNGNFAQYLGSNLHLSQGLEVQEWVQDSNHVNCHLGLDREASGVIDVFLPMPPLEVKVGGISCDFHPIGKGVYRFPVAFRNECSIHIQLIHSLES